MSKGLEGFDNQRQMDLLRFSRWLLRCAKYISDEEYAALEAMEGSVERLKDWDELRDELARAKQRAEMAEALNRKWNIAASSMYAGSEFIDDPERVFSSVRKTQEVQMEMIRRGAEQRQAAERERDEARKDTALRCAEIAEGDYWGKAANKIRRAFGLDDATMGGAK